MPRPRSKKDLASDEIQEALSHVGKAISLLGGRTRALSVKQNHRVFTVRKYLESIESRLHVCEDLIQLSNVPEAGATVAEDVLRSGGPADSVPDDLRDTASVGGDRDSD